MHPDDSAPQAFVALTEGEGRGLRHLAGLDGLRGIAVVVVLAFHAGFERLVGGYLGVSTFFTLSGFLITSLLLREARRTGSVRLRAFWGRRFRRLLPASLVTLAGIVVLFGGLVATADQRLALRGDVFAALFNVANWHQVATGRSYGQLFAAPSPTLHFWSLAIEEQFYLVFPVLLLGLWTLAGRRRRRLVPLLAVLTAASAAAPVVFSMSTDRVYFGTDTRAAELLLGALLAVGLSHDATRRRLVGPGWRHGVAAVGAVALAVQAWWWWSLPLETPWLYRGGLALYAVLSCAVLLAATVPSGPVHAVARTPVLRWLGVRSYGIYLVHWPIFLAVRQIWPDLSRAVSTAVGVGTTLVLAALSHRYVERPVRTRRWPAAGRATPAAAMGLAVVALVAIIPLPVDRTRLTTDFDVAQRTFQERVANQPNAGNRASDTTTSLAGGAGASEVAPEPRMAVFGDSTGIGVTLGLDRWSASAGYRGMVGGEARIGCGVSRFQRVRVDGTGTPDPTCLQWPVRWPQLVTRAQADVAILITGAWEVPDAQLPGSNRWTAIGDPVVDDFVRSELIKAVDALSSDGALVILVTWPHFGTWGDDGRPDAVARQMNPARMDRFNELLRQVAAARPDAARVVDFAGWLGDRSQDRSLRVDGTHFVEETFEPLAAEWFGPELHRTWQAWWATHHAGPPGQGLRGGS